MTLGPRTRRSLLAVHLVCSVGWIGAVLAYLALGTTAARTDEPDLVRATWGAMETVGWWVLLPLAIAALVTGIALAAGTRWGLLDHYWVVISLALTTSAVVVLALHLPDVSDVAAFTRTASPSELAMLGGDLLHATLALVLLLGVHALNVVKPPGLTRRGQRRRAARSRQPASTRR